MDEMLFDEAEVPAFSTVGALRKLLCSYADDTPLYVCGVPGLFFQNPKTKSILLEVQESSGYEIIHELMEFDDE